MAVYFGPFRLDDSANGYYITEVPRGTVKINQALTPLARLEGVKKSGQSIGERTIQMTMKVIGSSRSDLENKLDTLYLALSLPQQWLQMHQNDTRYFVADCIYEEAKLGVGDVIRANVTLTFICQKPYAISQTQSSWDSGLVSPSSIGSGNYQYSFTVPGGGTVFSRPLIYLTNKRTSLNVQVTIGVTSGSTYTGINVTATNIDVNVGDTLILIQQTTPLTLLPHYQIVTASTYAPAGSTYIYTNAYTANYSYPSNTGGYGSDHTVVQNDMAWQSVVLQQTVDNQYLSFNGYTDGNGLAPFNGNFVSIQCDPSVGWAVYDNTYGVLDFQGSFPTLNPRNTTYNLIINSPSTVAVDIYFTWYNRWLS